MLMLALSCFFLGLLQYAAYQPLFPHQSVKGIRTSRRPTVDTRRYCIGTNVRPLAGADGTPTDADTSWQTIIKEEIVPVRIDKITTKPQLITFDAFGTLIAPSQSIGRWYREALNSVCDMRIRLPRPALFFHAFKAVYKDMFVAAFFLHLINVEIDFIGVLCMCDIAYMQVLCASLLRSENRTDLRGVVVPRYRADLPDYEGHR